MIALRVPALLLATTLAAHAQCDPTTTTTTTTTTLPPPASCRYVPPPPAACTGDAACPSGYACVAGACVAGACATRADCPADGECVLPPDGDVGTCECWGCDALSCPIGCRTHFFLAGCVCDVEEDCPPEDDVCFLGFCS
jgi:hypothetical protein